MGLLTDPNSKQRTQLAVLVTKLHSLDKQNCRLTISCSGTTLCYPGYPIFLELFCFSFFPTHGMTTRHTSQVWRLLTHSSEQHAIIPRKRTAAWSSDQPLWPRARRPRLPLWFERRGQKIPRPCALPLDSGSISSTGSWSAHSELLLDLPAGRGQELHGNQCLRNPEGT